MQRTGITAAHAAGRHNPVKLGASPVTVRAPIAAANSAPTGTGERVLLVEDNITTQQTVALFLSDTGYRVACAATAGNGLALHREKPFDLIVLDLMLPDMDGLQVCRVLRQQSSVPIVVLTARTTEDDIVRGLEAGADDYVAKPFRSKELLARIRRCLDRARRPTETAGALRVGSIELDPARHVVRLSGQVVRLTRSEFELLAVLMRSPGRVFTRGQLIAAAFGADFDGYHRTVDTHIWSLRKKLGEQRGSPRYILSELGIGYRMSDADDL